jgi:hypothetical protein
VVSPTTFGVILVRALLKNNGSDLAYAQNLLQQCKLSTVPRPSKRKPLSTAAFRGVSANETNLTLKSLPLIPTLLLVMTILRLTATFAPENPPWNVSSSESEKIYRQLAVAGIRNGSYTPVPGVNLTLTGDTVYTTVVHVGKVDQVLLNNGWERNFPQGIYGSNYAERANVAIALSLEQTLDQALYANNPRFNPLQVTPSDSYLYTFSSKPPILSTGFWSLTLYLPDQHSFANPLDRYSLGDRSNLTYPDGSLVYGGSNSPRTDEPFQILVQSIATPPPANWTSKQAPLPQVDVLGEPADHYVAGFLLLRTRLMYLLHVSVPCEQKFFSFPLTLIRHKRSPPLRPYSTHDQRVVGVPGYNQNCYNYRLVMKMAYMYLDHLVRVIKLILRQSL